MKDLRKMIENLSKRISWELEIQRDTLRYALEEE